MIGVEHEARLLDLAAALQKQREQIVARANGLGCAPVELTAADGTYLLAPVTIAQAQVEIALLNLTLHRDVAAREVEQRPDDEPLPREIVVRCVATDLGNAIPGMTQERVRSIAEHIVAGLDMRGHVDL